jgi:ankyrin repeat protein
MELPPRNPGICANISKQYQKPYESLLDHGAIQTEFHNLIQILDKDNDPAALPIKVTLVAAIHDGGEIETTKINLQTKNGESALSIAAKHGFSNVVKFLISKGANKEHFTNEHHTPLSLAVSENHLKVVKVLFEEWISPNSHEEPYLHLSPIFNVKSREIAQLLVDNDAVTNGLYNNKNQSPLTVACQNGFLDVVEFFLDDGLDINHLDSDNKTSLFYALSNKHHDVLNLLNSKEAQNVFCTK